MRSIFVAVVLVATACTPPSSSAPATPAVSPTSAAATATAAAPSTPTSPTAVTTASPQASASPFGPTVGLPDLEASGSLVGFIAADRDRVAFTSSNELRLLDVASGSRRLVHRADGGRGLQLAADGLRGESLAFAESSFDDTTQRWRMRVLRLDLGSASVSLLDEYQSIQVGGGDAWRQWPWAITNGRDVAWLRVTDGPAGRPLVEAVLWRDGRSRVVRTGSTVTFIALDEDGRLAVSRLAPPGATADLALDMAGSTRIVAERSQEEGGPVAIVGDRLLWAVGSGTVARIRSGELISLAGVREPVALDADCGFVGASARHVVAFCGRDRLLAVDTRTGDRGSVQAFSSRAISRVAVVWVDTSRRWWHSRVDR